MKPEEENEKSQCFGPYLAVTTLFFLSIYPFAGTGMCLSDNARSLHDKMPQRVR
jgi:hypothetical protein